MGDPTPAPTAIPNTTTSDALAHSRAFLDASLKSEVRRAYAIIGVLVLILIPILIPNPSEALDAHVKIVGVAGFAALFAVNLLVVFVARRAARLNRAIPDWFTLTTVVLECLVPTGMLYSHIARATLPPYTALVAPPILGYGILIGLTTLRLRPSLCILAALVSAGGYVGLLAHVYYGLGLREPNTGLPPIGYINLPLLIFIGGIGAAWVAREIRAHMLAALGEAETRRRVERMEQDLAIARSIQRALLPRSTPEIPGYDIAGWNRPADQTGGDYYDWQRLPDGHWIVSLADVAGHGVGPAMVTAACRAYMRASASHHPDQASLTTHVNALLADDLPDGRFVTMVSVVIDPRGGPLTLLSAGHGPIVLYVGSTGELRDIMPQDAPLAITPDRRYQPAQSIALGPGDVLALITDGFIEWPRPDEHGRRTEFGIDRLRDSLRRHAHLPPPAMIDAVARDVASFAGPHPQEDDLTMVVVRRTR